jgi:parallel beta-helix repeat protein
MMIAGTAWSSQITVTGEVSGVWSTDTVSVTGDLYVLSGQTLTIQPGVEVLFTGPFDLNVQGLLTAVGTPADSIIFSRSRPSEESRWSGIRFDSADGSSLLQYCRLEWAKNSGASPDVRGGAVWINRCSPTISHCLIINNYSHNESYNGAGGGICLNEDSDAVIEYCTITLNQSDSGGGICVGAGCHGIIRYCRIESNEAYHAGGGIYVAAGAESSIYGNTIISNSSEGYGGGGINLWSATWLYGTTSDIHDNLIANNSATDAGGGIYSRYDASVMYDNTIISNSAAQGGGLYVLTFSDLPPIFFNSIVWGNNAQLGHQILLDPSMGSTATISYCTVLGGWLGPGIIDQYPDFVDTLLGDYRLNWGSPCIDLGAPELSYFDPDSTRADIGIGYFDQSAPVRILLTPHSPSVQVPSEGGDFSYTMRAVNISGLPQQVAVWCDATMPNGQSFGPVFGPVQVDVPAEVTLTRMRTQIVPAAAPAGAYSFNAYAAIGADTSKDSFTFVKRGNGIRIGVSGGWINTGEEFLPIPVVSSTSSLQAGGFVLHGASPNPFNARTVIRFNLPEASQVRLEVFDASGRTITLPVAAASNQQMEAGSHEIAFDGALLPSGVYLYRLWVGAKATTAKMVLIK